MASIATYVVYALQALSIFSKIYYKNGIIKQGMELKSLNGGVIVSHFDKTKVRLKNEYNIDIIKDILLDYENRVILFMDTTKKPVSFDIISGQLENIGFEGHSTIELNDVLDCIDYNNKYAEVSSRNAYRKYVLSNFFVEGEVTEVTFPVIRKSERYWLRFSIFPVKDLPHLYSIYVFNLTELMNIEELNYEKTHKDALTGLFNSYSFNYHYGIRYTMPNLHVFYLDLDNFKEINDTSGHITGNQCLTEFAAILKSYEKEFDRFYRIGGDEFVGLVFKERQEIETMAKDIIKRTNAIKLLNSDLKVGVSIGITKYLVDQDPVRKADELLYKVKESGKNNYIYE